MRFDTIIMGGGLSGLTAGIALAKAGQDVAIVSKGQSTLHFGSGSLELLGRDNDGNDVFKPLEAIAKLDDCHPYKKVGNVEQLAREAQQLLAQAGIETTGSAQANHWRLSPIGALKPAWLSLNGMATVDDCDKLPWRKVAVLNVMNYLDFPTTLLKASLRNRGAEVDVMGFTTPELDEARRSPSEMRATNIAKVVENNDLVIKVADAINRKLEGKTHDMVLLPAVLGFGNSAKGEQLLKLINGKAGFVATLPPSVPGVRMQTMLRKYFKSLGGTFIAGDEAVKGNIEGGKVKSIASLKLEDETLEAANFVLATGSFMSRGLVATYDGIYEPVMGLDVDTMGLDRTTWTAQEANDPQPYMMMGVATDGNLRCKKDGTTLANLYAAGAILSGHNSVKLGDATGVDMLTALQVAKNIINQQ